MTVTSPVDPEFRLQSVGEPICEELKSSADPWYSVRVLIAVLFIVVPLMLAATWVCLLFIR
jgi:hypothetical protein